MREKIKTGAWGPGVLLPSRRDMSKEYGVDVNTVQKAMSILLQDGLLRVENGRGTFVAAPIVSPPEQVLAPEVAPPALNLGIVMFVDPYYDTSIPGRRRDSLIVAEAFERAVTERGGITHFVNTYGHPGTPEYVQSAIHDLVRDLGVKGVLIASSRHQFDVFEAARMSIVPAVVVEGHSSPVAVHQVYSDHREAGYRAANVLIKNGYEKLLYVAPWTGDWVVDRLNGIHDAAASRSIPVISRVDSSVDAWHCVNDQPTVSAEFAQSIAADDIAGCGIVACNDVTAIGLMRRAADLGLTAGVEYSIVSFDDLQIAREAGLATFRPPLAAMGELVVEKLASIIAGQDVPMRTCVNYEFVMRRSLRRRLPGLMASPTESARLINAV